MALSGHALISISIDATSRGIDIQKNDLSTLSPITVEEYVTFLNAVDSSSNVECDSLYDQTLESQISCFYQDDHWIYQVSMAADKDAPLNLDKAQETSYRDWIENVSVTTAKYNADGETSSLIQKQAALDEQQEASSPLMMLSFFGSTKARTEKKAAEAQKKEGNLKARTESESDVKRDKAKLEAAETDRDTTKKASQGNGYWGSQAKAAEPYIATAKVVATLTSTKADDNVVDLIGRGAQLVQYFKRTNAERNLPAKEEAVSKAKEKVALSTSKLEDVQKKVEADAKPTSRLWGRR
ncbi:MAG: hypothetical protein NT164_00935 [Verrucomicrobiae bacterium]|nr:hypothetical protein [Verrucomicrobiae bacterium]